MQQDTTSKIRPDLIPRQCSLGLGRVTHIQQVEPSLEGTSCCTQSCMSTPKKAEMDLSDHAPLPKEVYATVMFLIPDIQFPCDSKVVRVVAPSMVMNLHNVNLGRNCVCKEEHGHLTPNSCGA